MRSGAVSPTRKEFLMAWTAAALLPGAMAAETAGHRLLIVVAHPDDEYAFAATTFRLVKELGWTADQVIVTNGESGYRYADLAGIFYGAALADEADARAHLPAIRKEEAKRAGKILGIRRHYFLDQRDLGFQTDAAQADSRNWDRPKLHAFLADLLAREQYDVVFTLLPAAQTHGHHRAATILALEAVADLPASQRPLVFGVEAHARQTPAAEFRGLEAAPVTRTTQADPVFTFDRTVSFGYRRALNYQIVVNWVIAEHKSQGLFQMDSGKYDLEQFWLFEVSGNSSTRLEAFRGIVTPPGPQAGARTATGARL
ncbi:MAG TPA: PIG-L family deacetylase [Bryobacteraceae bacterium]|jgi:LmbE family N-acetylglucosaminyl deacetylase|nr:PIG-L family deacetylase [Bryobacteraceae bacterium]